MNLRWAILTGEYPPHEGGVGAYTRLVAAGLAQAGDDVTVYAPPAPGPVLNDVGVKVHRLPDHFGPRGLAALNRVLSASPPPDRILVQYVPHAFGSKGLNLPFAVWLARRGSRIAPVWVMFHEVAFPLVRRPWRHAFLAVVNRLMARQIGHSAGRVFVSIPAWGAMLRRIAPRAPRAEWRPIPCILQGRASLPQIEVVRQRYAPRPGEWLLGHFGTYGQQVRELLRQTLPSLLANDSARTALLLGRGSEAFRDVLLRQQPSLASRIHATGVLTDDAACAHLQACDWMYQPFVDGISSRRTSLMASLALGRPVVTNLGPLREPIWAELGCVALAHSPKANELLSTAEAAFRMPHNERVALGLRAAKVYADRFSIEHTLAALRSAKESGI